MRKRAITIAAGAVLVAAVAGGGIAWGTAGGDGDESVKGPAADRARAAALAHVRGGSATSVERGDDGAAWEVEVRRGDGSTIEVELDRSYRVLGSARDSEEEGKDDEDASSSPALPVGGEVVKLDPENFSVEIDNAYWPMRPGSKWVYREGSRRVEVTVTKKTKQIAGIQARVVHDVVTENGELKEDTYDWYAQDAWGNVWYLGEDTKEYENGKVVSTAGSWEAGVDGAQAGVIVPAEPKPGMAYRQEYYEGEAEDAAEVVSVNANARVPFGSFDGVLKTKDYTPLEPDLVEHKFYAKGVGPVLAITVSGGSGREELISFAAP